MLRQMMTIFAGVLALAGAPARPQTGEYWSGTLAVTSAVNLTVGVAIALDDAGVPRGTIDSPDQQTFDIPIADVVKDAERLAFTVPTLGAQFEGVLRRTNPRADDTWRDTAVYSILGEEWPAVRDGLEGRLARFQ